MDRELFYEIVLFAEKRGYKDHLAMLPVMPLCETSATLLEKKIFWQRRYEIIFNHEFAKSLFTCKHEHLEKYIIGSFIEKCADCGSVNLIGMKWNNWTDYLSKIVLEDEPFEYLNKEYKRIKNVD